MTIKVWRQRSISLATLPKIGEPFATQLPHWQLACIQCVQEKRTLWQWIFRRPKMWKCTARYEPTGHTESETP